MKNTNNAKMSRLLSRDNIMPDDEKDRTYIKVGDSPK